jgi:hypothetical protein
VLTLRAADEGGKRVVMGKIMKKTMGMATKTILTMR